MCPRFVDREGSVQLDKPPARADKVCAEDVRVDNYGSGARAGHYGVMAAKNSASSSSVRLSWYKTARLHGEIGDVPPAEYQTAWYRQERPAMTAGTP